jgi:lipopolysaccharide biosynthesis glycosyltransferase
VSRTSELQTREFAFAGEGAYSIPLAAAIGGVLAHLDPQAPVRFWLLDLGLEHSARRRVERAIKRSPIPSATLEWVTLRPDAIRNLETTGHLRPATYARLLLPSALPDAVKTIVFLDSDIVVRSDLTFLTQLDLGPSPLAGVQDYVVETVGGSRSAISELTPRAADAKYFNGGVLVFNLALWRREALADQIFEFAARHEPLPLADQDALNGVIHDWFELSPDWNVQSRIFWLSDAPRTAFVRELDDARASLLEDAKIMHFSGPSKPWEPWDKHPRVALWRKSLQRSRCLGWREQLRWSAAYLPRRAIARLALPLRSIVGRALRRLGGRR